MPVAVAHRVDTLKLHSNKAARLWLMVGLGLFASGAAQAEVLDGVQLPDRTVKVGERRYRVPQDWENTLKYFKTAYPSAQYPRHTIVNQPGVKAIHIANPEGHGGWVGLNIYDANDEIRVYVVPPDGTQKPAKKAPATPQKKK